MTPGHDVHRSVVWVENATPKVGTAGSDLIKNGGDTSCTRHRYNDIIMLNVSADISVCVDDPKIVFLTPSRN